MSVGDALRALQDAGKWLAANPIALWGAALSTALAVREIWRSRTGIHFRVQEYKQFQQAGGIVLVTEDVAPGGESMVVVDVYNRGRDPIHLEQVGLHMKPGGWMIFNQAEGMEQLPKKLEPSDGFTMASLSEKVGGVLTKKHWTIDHIDGPFCRDGAGRTYKRRLKRSERESLRNALAPAQGGQ